MIRRLDSATSANPGTVVGQLVGGRETRFTAYAFAGKRTVFLAPSL